MVWNGDGQCTETFPTTPLVTPLLSVSGEKTLAGISSGGSDDEQRVIDAEHLQPDC